MSPYSTIAFVAVGVVLALPSRASLRPLMWLGTIVTALIGATALLGYAWNALELTTDQWMPPVAVHTAFAFFLLSLGAGIACGLVSPSAVADAKGRARIESKVLVKSTARLSGIPVILMTGNGERSAVLRSRELGVAAFVVKPFYRAGLLGKLAATLNPLATGGHLISTRLG